MKMADDPERHRPGLERWIVRNPDHLIVYNRVAREMRLATWSATQLDLYPATPRATKGRPLRNSGFVWAIAVLASVLAASSAAFLVLRDQQRPGDSISSGAPIVAQSWSSDANDIRRTRLPDGSVVTLDRDSAIAIRYSADRRMIELSRGRVRFEVAHDTSRPFVVLTPGGSVTATGTVFDVEVRGTVRVHLMLGAVEVAMARNSSANGDAPVRLVPGQKLEFAARQQAVAPVPQAAPAADGRWLSGTMSFEDMPLADIIAQTNAYSSSRISVSEPGLLQKEMFVDLDIRDADAVARKLAVLLDLTVDRSQPGKLILRSR
ncbi:FecR family protein [Novosphingobium naphthalenivorans]|uniref:FecR family protein n=1 Tax=Novosphingobium naphthalenivorans TaxID=273168 RepID=UPI001C3F4637|nr:FecR domain-containing protein [Novosphingobium naphthalenivorans]